MTLGTRLDNLLITNLASKMAAKLSFQSNLEFTGKYIVREVLPVIFTRELALELQLNTIRRGI